MAAKDATEPEVLTIAQVRAGRALLAWSQGDLAKAANIAQSTVADFERGRRTPVPANTEAMRAALIKAGVSFPRGGAVMGPPIPGLGAGREAPAPVRWINAIDLEQWAARRDGQGSLPTLMNRLVRASAGPNARLIFPADEAITQSGWDGRVQTDVGDAFLPRGFSGWEIGAQRSGIPRKAQEDYEKRTLAPAPLDPPHAAFVFVTPRQWSGKAQWAEARRAEAKWREVRVYDANDLVAWIEQFPAIGLWLAITMGKRPPGAYPLEEVWLDWSLATQWPLTEELVLSDRDEDAAHVLRWLRDDPSVLALKAESPADVAAFLHATIASLPEAIAQHYTARAVVAASAEAARSLADSATQLIIVLMEHEPGLAQRMAKNGHHVLIAYGDVDHAEGDVRTLARPSLDGIEVALTHAGIASQRAHTLARDSSRSLAVLRRLIPTAPGRLPDWAQSSPPRALIAALLAGAWDAKSPGDRAILERLAGEGAYEEIERALAPHIRRLDSPLRKAGTTWRVASPRDAWFLLAHFLTQADVDRYQQAAIDVLSAHDPRYDVDPDERWTAEIDGVRPDYSGWLRRGLGEVLILLSLFGDRTLDARDGSARARRIVRELLHGASAARWWSLSRDFRLLAEASPEGFIEAVNESLARNDPPIKSLFGADGDPLFGSEHLSDLLWALEALAWSPAYVSGVVDTLAKLDAIDPGGRFTNRPLNTLRHIFSLWAPQTNASLDERIKMLDRLLQTQPGPAWKLLKEILPKGHDISMPTSPPRWRDFSEERRERPTYALMDRGARDVSAKLIEAAGQDLNRWIELVERVKDFAPDSQPVIQAMDDAVQASNDADARDRLRDALRRELHRHREYPDVEWALKSAELDSLQAIYDALEPSEPVRRYAWLFESGAHLPNPIQRGWREEEEQLAEERRQTVRAIIAEHGSDMLFKLAAAVKTPGFIGGALVQDGVEEATRQDVLKRGLTSTDTKESDIAYGMIFLLHRDRGQDWSHALLARAREEGWGVDAELTILAALPQIRWTWDEAQALGPAVEEKYWKRSQVLWIDGDIADIEHAARKLMEVGRAHHTIHLLGHAEGKGRLSSQILIDVLDQAVKDFTERDEGDGASMFRYHVAEMLKQLDKRDDVDPNVLLGLEWTYLPLLEYSGRPAKVLLEALAERPEFFDEVMRAAYKASEESGVVEALPENPERAQQMAMQAYELLRVWNKVPGSDATGKVDPAKLKAWVRQARLLAAANGRRAIVDQKIGEVFSNSAEEEDGSWPLIAIRDVIEELQNEELENGFAIGVYNGRGVTTRGMRDGGALEREEAAYYKGHARHAMIEWPRTAAVLERIAADYEAEAKVHDQRVEQLDWRT